MSFWPRFIGSSLAVVATTAGFIALAVHLEQTESFSRKPSVALRVWTGDLPVADLPAELEKAQAELAAAQKATATAEEAVKAHQLVAEELASFQQALQDRIAEKQAGVWAQPVPPASQ